MSVVSNLFPPIVKDAQPAFLRTGVCNIYFSLSSFNSIDDIKHAQITVVNQKTNRNALQTSKYPLGIKFTTVYTERWPTSDYKYYVTISNTDVVDNIFALNEFYKVQIRFGDNELPVSSSLNITWLNNNLDHFSEWSQVCLIKGIEHPYISINTLGNDDAEDDTNNNYRLNPSFLIQPTSFSGTLYYKENENIEKETLKSYNITLRNRIDDVIIQSEEIYTNQYHPNQFYYDLKYDLQKNSSYTLDFNYTTTNLYKHTSNFIFNISASADNQLHATLDVTPDEERGRMKINIVFTKDMPSYNTYRNLIIKRASSKTNFTEWENIKYLTHNWDYEHLWYDDTIESGVWYKYRVQEDASSNALKTTITQPVMCVFEDIFLTDKNRQLKVQFNPSISDFKYNVNESQQITLGSQYPYVKRNGNNYYRSFNISGLISSLVDQQGWYNPNYNEEHGYFYYKNIAQPFTNANELYGDNAVSLYSSYNQENDISYQRDYIYERQFREKVMEFLYQNNIKLFRSLTEGNILIKLTNISLSPIEALGRMLYSFGATAIEIDDNNLNNLDKYDIINKFYYTYSKLTITDTFENEQSLIDRFYEELPILNKKDTDIMQLKFIYSGHDNIVIYAKPINNNTMFRYILQNGQLVLTYSDADPIAECYFFGIHLNQGEFTITNEYYYSTDDIQTPINFNVYYISKEQAYLINHYITYYHDSGLLDTYPEEVIPRIAINNQHSLLVETEYYKMIYYNGHWYPFSENNDIMIDSLNTTIEYLYRVKKED